MGLSPGIAGGRGRSPWPRLSVAAAVLLGLLVARPGQAQVPRLIAEGRVGVMLPSSPLSGDPPEGGATTGLSYGAGFAFAVRGGLYVNLGFSQHRLTCSVGCSGLGDLTATGFDLALRYAVVAGPVIPYVRLGALPYTVESAGGMESGADRLSDRTWGWEAGAGIGLPVSEHVHLSPGLRFVSLTPTFPTSAEGSAGEGSLDLKGWILDVGLVWAF